MIPVPFGTAARADIVSDYVDSNWSPYKNQAIGDIWLSQDLDKCSLLQDFALWGQLMILEEPF